MHITGPWRRSAHAAGLLRADGRPAQTIFAEMTELATSTGAVNLGQGVPEDGAPPEVLEAARAAIADGRNQYAPGIGVPALRRAVAEHQRRWYGLDVDPDREVVVTAGATEAIAAVLLALVEPGDEIVAIEPYYDEYAALAGLTDAKLVTVPLRRATVATLPPASGADPAPPRFTIDPDELASAVTDRTRLIIVNTPHNPTGALLPRETLAHIVRVAERHNALIVTDEVYEHLAYGGTHTPIAAIPGARDRTITISSAGKTFSATGWKVGWLTAPPSLAQSVLMVKQYLTYSNGTPFQHAVAVGLGLPDAVFEGRRQDLGRRAAKLADALARLGLDVARPAAGYFVCADAAPLGARDGADFARTLASEAGVVSIPVASFCRDGSEAGRTFGTWLRFAACKHDATLDEAIARLEAR
ncbi:aminotransferase class I/II-fold pyridoxal phosphate-dependent enzyme [Pseudoclavibacter endophyticus]|uniref:Aminotransferase class I/II-fold pyridoxal phosphate-dependent enzyme n=1 Tax=Pseudoclavibacter endophyticus TaxID=1778590 RepID=A0A6H9WGP3_9MICO|nr:aminotransferase class I/II-fold pyridoxal phosphate-dependent enzyme [Pseudoclavibacter endophyticus]KAB1646771.1 aminotransferase class I/II-fold pyridoxal phosphate-dependent enzyme [Pseudoclavibacter endophyticus]